MEKEKKFNIIKLVIIIACAILFIGLILPYESAIGEHKEYLQKNPDTMNVKEINLTNKDAISVLKLAHPVKFASMENWENEIDVKTIFNLAFLDDNEHLVLITKIIRGLKNKDFVNSLVDLPIDQLKEYLEREVLS